MEGIMSSEDKELVVKAKNGNDIAFEELVHRYDKQVFSIAANYVRTAEEAKDIYQEVFIRVYKGLPRFELRSEFSTWLYRIATNVCITYHSRARRHRHVSMSQDYDDEDIESYKSANMLTDETASDQETLNSEIRVHIQEALNGLSPKQKMVFTLKHFHGYKLKEIASIMKCAEGTVKRYLFIAVKRMRLQLQDILN
jgi:RNA polymerase sigma-70 factor (ECF subfamily)